MKADLKKELGIILLVLAPVLFVLIQGNAIPEQVPVHWNIEGEIDRYGSKWTTILINLGIYPLLLLLPRIDPRKKNYEIFSSSYYKIRFGLHLFMSALDIMLLLYASGVDIPVTRIVITSVLLLFIILGNYMGNIRPNYFVGIRTPWTLENAEVWRKTHLLAGRLWFWTGLLCLLISFFINNPERFPVLVVLIAAISLVPVVYSYLIFRKLKNSPDTHGDEANLS